MHSVHAARVDDANHRNPIGICLLFELIMYLLQLERGTASIEIVLGIAREIDRLLHWLSITLPRLDVVYDSLPVLLIGRGLTYVSFDDFFCEIRRLVRWYILCCCCS